MSLYVFGWPSDLGGADTKTAHLLQLLANEIPITVVPNAANQLKQRHWTDRLDRWGVAYCSLESLPQKLSGVALSLCNNQFFVGGLYEQAKRRGLKVVWSSEMMWHHPFEVDVIKAGGVDRLLYVSDLQKRALAYESFSDVPTRLTGNYINPEWFPFHRRSGSQNITLGRLSRADAEKYPENFPVFYEALGIQRVRFRAMGWSSQLAHKYRWHRFDSRWDLLPANHEPSHAFLNSLDLFIYILGHTFTESWGRSTVEAMLTGAIPLVPSGHNFPELIDSGTTGFICNDFKCFQSRACQLAEDPGMRKRMSDACHQRAFEMNDADDHRAVWLEALSVS